MKISRHQQRWTNGIAWFLVLVIFYVFSIAPAQFVATTMSQHQKWKPGHQSAWEFIYGPLNFASERWAPFGRMVGWLINQGHGLAMP